MAISKTPQRVNDDARPEPGPVSDLVEIARRNGEFRKNYGPWLGALLYWLSIKAAKATRPRPLLWSGLIAFGSVAGGFLLRHGISWM